MDFQKMMQQAQQMQFKMQEMQEKLGDIDVEGEAGGGMVRVLLSCRGEMQDMYIDPKAIQQAGEDKEMLEDLIIAAVNNANENKDAKIKEETQKMLQEMGLPPGTQLPF